MTYVLLFTHPVAAALFGWTFAMCIRQVGHFFFEPKGYDEANQATHEYKETRQGRVQPAPQGDPAHACGGWCRWCCTSSPTLFGVVPAALDEPVDLPSSTWRVCGSSLPAAALLGRTMQLFFMRDVKTGIVWFTKILTDPFHDIMLYHKAPLYLLRGELIESPKHA